MATRRCRHSFRAGSENVGRDGKNEKKKEIYQIWNSNVVHPLPLGTTPLVISLWDPFCYSGGLSPCRGLGSFHHHHLLAPAVDIVFFLFFFFSLSENFQLISWYCYKIMFYFVLFRQIFDFFLFFPVRLPFSFGGTEEDNPLIHRDFYSFFETVGNSFMQSWRCAVACPRYALSIRLCRIRPTAFTRRGGGGLATKFPFSQRLINDPACVCVLLRPAAESPPPKRKCRHLKNYFPTTTTKCCPFFKKLLFLLSHHISVILGTMGKQPTDWNAFFKRLWDSSSSQRRRAREFPPQSIWWNPHQLTSRERERVCVCILCTYTKSGRDRSVCNWRHPFRSLSLSLSHCPIPSSHCR